MCSISSAIGLGLGAMGASMQMSAAGERRDFNAKMIREKARLDYASQAREFIVEKNAALKEAYDASLEGEAAKGMSKAMGGGMGGGTIVNRLSDQSAQMARNVGKANDRADAANYNIVQEGAQTQIQSYWEYNKNELEYKDAQSAAYATLVSGI